MGVAAAGPGKSALQAMPSVGFYSTGRFASSVEPLNAGPRHCAANRQPPPLTPPRKYEHQSESSHSSSPLFRNQHFFSDQHWLKGLVGPPHHHTRHDPLLRRHYAGNPHRFQGPFTSAVINRMSPGTLSHFQPRAAKRLRVCQTVVGLDAPWGMNGVLP